jgi:hypothetical protein
MSISQTTCTSFKREQYLAIHDFSTDVLKIALYTSNATLGADTTVYTATEEISGAGYTAGGNVLIGVTVNESGTIAYVDFGDASWTGALTARGALIYNSSKSNKAIAVLDFGADKTSVTTFLVQMPVNDSVNALLRTV